MRTTARIPIFLTTAALAFVAVPIAAQSTGPQHDGFDPNAATTGHYHEGELGEKLMVLERALKCDCGCGLDVHSCQFQMQCGTSPVWSERIRTSLERGESVEAIEAGFVADYGVTVLMSPPAQGFNLLGYFLPMAAILTSGMLVGLLVRGGSRGKPVLATEVSDEDAGRLREAMARLEEQESPDW